MAIVRTTQELRTGDFLLRFKAKASQDDVHGMRSIRVRSLFGNRSYTWDSSLFAMIFFFFVVVGSPVHVFCFPSGV